jgi:hypothetical protein
MAWRAAAHDNVLGQVASGVSPRGLQQRLDEPSEWACFRLQHEQPAMALLEASGSRCVGRPSI